MKILIKGKKYELPNLKNPEGKGQEIQFAYNKTDTSGNENDEKVFQDGTTNEAVLAMLIDRLYVLQKEFPCRENAIVITKLEESLMWLNKRAVDQGNGNGE